MKIGIAVKPGLTAARDTLVDLEQWLHGRGVDAVWSTEAATLFASGSRTVVDRTTIPARVDLVLVLGGDGTLLAMASLAMFVSGSITAARAITAPPAAAGPAKTPPPAKAR